MKKAMLFAAGLGTRLYPITENKPKALVKVNHIPLLQRNIQYLSSFGIEEIVINVHHFSQQIKQFLAENPTEGVTYHISDESDEVLETGGGLVKAQSFFTEDFVVMNADILTNLNLHTLKEFPPKNKPLASLAVTDRKSSRKLLFDSKDRLQGWKNLKTHEQISNGNGLYLEKAFSGIQIIHPSIFTKMPASGKFSIIKTYLELMENHLILGYDHSGDLLIDVGKPEAIKKAENLFP